MPRVLALLAFVSLARQHPARDDPRDILRTALRAVESGSVASIQTRWRERVARDSTDRGAILGLASLARLSYDYATADRLSSRLVAQDHRRPDEIAVYARLDQAAAALSRGALAAADSQYALAAHEARLIHDRAAEGQALMRRALAQLRIGGPSAALELVSRAQRVIPAADTTAQAELLCQRANVLTVAARPSGRPDAFAGAALATRAGEVRLQAMCLQVVANSLPLESLIDSAIRVERTVADLDRRTHDRQGLAVALQRQGYLQVTLGDYGLARETLQQAMVEGRASGSLSPVAWAALNLAGIATLVGDVPGGSGYLAQAESLFTAQGDRTGLGVLVGYRGSLARLAGDLPGARRAYESGLAQSAHLLGQAPVYYHRLLAALAMEEGDLDRAERELVATRTIALAIGMGGYVKGLGQEFGILALKREDLPTAERFLTYHLETMGPGQPGRHYPAEVRLAQVYAHRGDLAGAEQIVTTAMDSLDAWRGRLTSRDLRLLVFEVRGEDLEPDLGLSDVLGRMVRAGRTGAAFRLAERRRARDLLDRMVRMEAFGGREKLLRAAVDTLRHSFGGIDLAEVSARIPDANTALLEYVAGFGGEPTILFALTRKGIHGFLLPTTDSLAREITRFNTLLESGATPSAVGARLGAALLGPVLQALDPGITRLVVVPDGPLHRLPFEALTLPAGGLALERYSISLAPSAAVAVDLWRRAPSTRPVEAAVLGNPAPATAGSSPPSAVTRDYLDAFAAAGGLPPLPGAAREARVVAGFAPRSDLRLGAAASESWLKRATLTRYRILHFATHALVDDQATTHTALALAPGEGEDGFVSPADLASLRLDADLVVLSGCRTAEGVVAGGEGVLGVIAPLLQAGARAVLATTWPVGDESSVRLIGDFYRGLAAGDPASDALRSAKLAAMRRGLGPREWAGFVLIGNPAVTIPLRRTLFYGLWSTRRRALERITAPDVSVARTHQR